MSAAEQVKPDCCHTPAVVSTLLTPLPVSCPLTTPHHYRRVWILIISLLVSLLFTESRIQYKLPSPCCSCINSTAPGYLTELKKLKNRPVSYCTLPDTSFFLSFFFFFFFLSFFFVLFFWSSFCVYALAWSDIFFLCCTVCLEQSPLQN